MESDAILSSQLEFQRYFYEVKYEKWLKNFREKESNSSGKVEALRTELLSLKENLRSRKKEILATKKIVKNKEKLKKLLNDDLEVLIDAKNRPAKGEEKSESVKKLEMKIQKSNEFLGILQKECEEHFNKLG
eukprot:GHVP01024210.1.p1 GENE.GHVP01024210.1~~GHVP01024210.1.p1  ORF type:complete len:132 (-),score=42.59 GHVP01024210.1:44-439(-)